MKKLWLLLVFAIALVACETSLITNPSDPLAGKPVVITLPDGTTVVAPTPAPVAPARQIFADNGVIRLAIDLGMGGAITHLSEKGGPNMVNNHDLGRQIQTALYAGPTVYKPHGKEPPASSYNNGWNPNQAGNSVGQTSAVLAWQQPDASHLYVKTRPMFWAYADEVADCVYETWIELIGNTANVRVRVTIQRSDTTQYYPRTQEAPGIYLNAPWSVMHTYDGTQPFSNAPVRAKVFKDQEAETIYATENWVALLNDAGRGLGLWQENKYRYGASFFGTSRNGGELDNNTSNISGSDFAHLEHNAVWEYEYSLVVGSLADIRLFAYQKPRPPAVPNYRFVSDRQGWYSTSERDQGYPVRGELSILFGGFDKDRAFSPLAFWRAGDMPKLYIQAAFTSKAPTVQLVFRKPGDVDFLPIPERLVEFPIIGDGQYRTYEVKMQGTSSGWQGDIQQIGIKPTLADPYTRMRLRSVTATPP
jgi:hypothetical protein